MKYYFLTSINSKTLVAGTILGPSLEMLSTRSLTTSVSKVTVSEEPLKYVMLISAAFAHLS